MWDSDSVLIAASPPTPPHTLRCRQIVLSVTQDEFFKVHKDSNYGDLGVAIKAMLDEYTRSRGARARDWTW